MSPFCSPLLFVLAAFLAVGCGRTSVVPDPCAGQDADGDGVCDGVDACLGYDRTGDADDDGVCDDRDLCRGDDASGDGDSDGACDDDDPCPVDNPDDTDGDGVCQSVDPCPLDNPDDTDGDGVCDSVDPCPLDNPDDTDGDGVCDTADPCPLDNPDDADGDGVCEEVDLCRGQDLMGDTDGDGVCNDLDPCPVDVGDDYDGDGVCNGVDVCLAGDDSVDVDGNGTPDACDCGTLVVAVLPARGASPTFLERRWADYGPCPVVLEPVNHPVTVASLQAIGATTLLVGNPAGGIETYAPSEMQAIRDFVTAGHGGIVVTFLLLYLPPSSELWDHTAIADLAGVDASQLASQSVPGDTFVDVHEPYHPISENLCCRYALLGGWLGCQDTTAGWPAALLPGAEIIQSDAAYVNSVIVYEAGTHRGVWFTGYPEYQGTRDGERALYNAVRWTSK